MLFVEDITAVVLWLLVTVISINLVFLAFVFYRRVARERYHVSKDAARSRFSPVVEDLVAEKLRPEQAAELLSQAASATEHEAVEELLLKAMTPRNHLRLSEVFFSLGYVQRWANAAFDRKRARALVVAVRRREMRGAVPVRRAKFTDHIRKLQLFSIRRAIAVRHLGQLAPEIAFEFSREALLDPATDVRRTAITNMGGNPCPAAIPVLLEELRRSVEEGNDVSLRTTKTALVSFQMSDLEQFVPMLTHPHWQVRFFVVDILREIVSRAARHAPLSRKDFPEEAYHLFLDKLVRDDSADVRARSGFVVKHFQDQRALEALRTLLRDDNEFVRMHTVRACADPYYADLVTEVMSCVTDRRWRVRESAVRALAAFGRSGSHAIWEMFIRTSDQYACEQLADEMQRSGIVRQLVPAFASGGAAAKLAHDVSRKLAGMGKSSILNELMMSAVGDNAQLGLMDAMLDSPTPDYMHNLERLAAHGKGPAAMRAREIARQADAKAAAKGMSRG